MIRFPFCDPAGVFPEHDVNELSEDNSIGMVETRAGDVRGDVLVDLHRLRTAIMCYEREFDGSRFAEVAVVEIDDGDKLPALALTSKSPVDGRAVLVAPRVSHNGGTEGPRTGADGLVETNGGGGRPGVGPRDGGRYDD